MANAITMLTAKIIITIIRKINTRKKNKRGGNTREKKLTKQEILGLVVFPNPKLLIFENEKMLKCSFSPIDILKGS